MYTTRTCQVRDVLICVVYSSYPSLATLLSMALGCHSAITPPIITFILFFFFHDTASTEIYTLSLHDRSSDLHRRNLALTLLRRRRRLFRAIVLERRERGGDRLGTFLRHRRFGEVARGVVGAARGLEQQRRDRKSTRLNSSH